MNSTKLRVNRFVVRKSGHSVYDQGFHSGLNVIRGDNSTGKSTVMELLSYGLGADIKASRWKKEALSCDEVFVDVNINGREFVLKRSIQGDANKPPISIFEGGYELASSSSVGWTKYKYQKSSNRKSFSMQIFELLGYQQSSTADGDSLTVHQIMRLLYVDQDTPASNIFRLESFQYDKDTMRRAIGEFLFGYDDLESHVVRQKLQFARRAFDKLDEELKAVYRILGKTNSNGSTQQLHGEIAELQAGLSSLEQQGLGLRKKMRSPETNNLASEANEIAKKIDAVSAEIFSLEQELISVGYDLGENVEFQSALEERKKAIQESRATVTFLGQVAYEYCPSCFTPIEQVAEHNHCGLCKSEPSPHSFDETYIQALNELDFQNEETKSIIRKQQELKVKLRSDIQLCKEELHNLRKKFNEVHSYTADYELELTRVASEKGFIQSQIQSLTDRLELASELDSKVMEKEELQSSISILSDKLDGLEKKQAVRARKVAGKISGLVVELVSQDIGTEDGFGAAEKFEFEFAPNSIRLDDRANFSASSNVLLKNSFHLSVLLTAVSDDQFRIPCFTMFDNIEDKGMTEERSRNFQKILLERLTPIEDEVQVIITTSMVAQELDNDDYGVGPFYRKGQHTLEI